MIEFSINQPDKDKKYIKRPGAYGIFKNVNNLIALIKTKTGYFLPGGGIENGELPDECLKRECLEEIGAEIIILDNFAYGNYYFYSTILNKDMESMGYFFICKIDNFLDISTEDDHELIWIEPGEAIQLLYLDNQREAVRIFKENNA
jgi:8-oxo-dGTP diphosphatase